MQAIKDCHRALKAAAFLVYRCENITAFCRTEIKTNAQSETPNGELTNRQLAPTWCEVRDLVAVGRKADVRRTLSEVRVWPKADILIAWANVRFRG